jgi:aryl-alcohol dehydrogenase-like predicted oxidoreductase
MQWAIPEDQALLILKHAFDRGINTWDTVSSSLFLAKGDAF